MGCMGSTTEERPTSDQSQFHHDLFWVPVIASDGKKTKTKWVRIRGCQLRDFWGGGGGGIRGISGDCRKCLKALREAARCREVTTSLPTSVRPTISLLIQETREDNTHVATSHLPLSTVISTHPPFPTVIATPASFPTVIATETPSPTAITTALTFEHISSSPHTTPLATRDNVDHGALCVVCMEKRPELLFLPCHHANTCRGCDLLSRCPICASTIVDRVRIFL